MREFPRRLTVTVLLALLGIGSGAWSAYGHEHAILESWTVLDDVWLGPGVLFGLVIAMALSLLRLVHPVAALGWLIAVVASWIGAVKIARVLVDVAYRGDSPVGFMGASAIAGAAGAIGVGLATRLLFRGMRTPLAFGVLILVGAGSGCLAIGLGDTPYPLYLAWQGGVAACLGINLSMKPPAPGSVGSARG